MVVERNLETTRWPKMDITNCRSMELLSRLGLADGLREQGKLFIHYSIAHAFKNLLNARQVQRI